VSGAAAAQPPRGGVLDRLAGAPISWGVCEVPGWGHQLAPGHVLGEMRALGLVATEFGPDGFLPDAPGEKAATLAAYDLRAVGAFVPTVLHDPARDPVPEVDRALDGLVAAGADVLVLAAATGLDGYDTRPVLDDDAWKTLLDHLDRVVAHAAGRGVRATLHPHVGTVVEREDEVRRVLDASDVPLCLDTGHLLVGGTDPVALAREVPGRVTHVHLKDVDADLAARVQHGAVTYYDAVRAGLYRPLGQGDVDVGGVLDALEGDTYTGWYVLEQDVVLADATSAGPALADVRASVAWLRAVAG
jgi:inosose dehydratase